MNGQARQVEGEFDSQIYSHPNGSGHCLACGNATTDAVIA